MSDGVVVVIILLIMSMTMLFLEGYRSYKHAKRCVYNEKLFCYNWRCPNTSNSNKPKFAEYMDAVKQLHSCDSVANASGDSNCNCKDPGLTSGDAAIDGFIPNNPSALYNTAYDGTNVKKYGTQSTTFSYKLGNTNTPATGAYSTGLRFCSSADTGKPNLA